MTDSAYSVQTQHDRITLGGGESADLSYTVTNKTGLILRTGFDIQADGDVQAEWATIADASEQQLEAGQTINLNVTIKAPAALEAGGGKFSLRAFDADAPEERSGVGNWIDVGLTKTEVKKSSWLKIALIAAGVVVLLGAGVWGVLGLIGGDDKKDEPTPAKTPVVARMSASSARGIAPLEVTFTDQSTGEPSERVWTFGDAEPVKGAEASIKHTFEQPGEYVVRLTVSRGPGGESKTGLAEGAEVVDAMEGAGDEAKAAEATAPSAGDLDATEVVITVLPRVSAEFVATPQRIRAGMNVHFDNRSLGPIASWEWDFGNGKKSSKQFPDDQTYTEPGLYDVTLVVRGADEENVAKFEGKINVDEPGTARFAIQGARTGDHPLTVQFQNQSVGAQTTLWDFGDGSTSTQASPTHVYQKSGRFTVTLTITGPSGTDKFSQPSAVVVTSPPSVTLTGNTSRIERMASVTFQYQTAGDVSSRTITFGDGGSQRLTGASGRIVHRYQGVGPFTATMTVRGQSGKVATSQHRIVVDPKKEIVAVNSRQFGRLHPTRQALRNGVKVGDCDFKGNGPNIRALARLKVVGRTLTAYFEFDAVETKSDWSTARGKWSFPLYTAKAGWKIARIVSPSVAASSEYRDEWKFTAKGHGYHRRNGTYVHFTVRGDTNGDDICGRTSDDTHMIALVRNVRVEIVEDVQPVKRVRALPVDAATHKAIRRR